MGRSRYTKSILLPDIDWVEIPAGEGSAKQTLTLDRFFSRYLITNSQYQTFIDAGGYSDKRWWRDLIKPEPGESSWKQANRPRETVNWYEALAFTRWLSAQLGFDITLSTDQQWEKAARGTDGRKYPWGTGFETGDANVNDTSAGDDNLQQTTAVGLYPHRASPYQLKDMAGNVWEWCLNKYEKPEQIATDQSMDSRVLRGCAWGVDPAHAHCYERSWNYPVNRNLYLGFRVVCSSPYTDH